MRPTMNNFQLSISGMTCGHCEKSVKTAIKLVDAQAVVSINREAGTADIATDQSAQIFIDAVIAEGYPTTLAV